MSRSTDNSNYWLHTWENRICNTAWVVLCSLLLWLWLASAPVNAGWMPDTPVVVDDGGCGDD